MHLLDESKMGLSFGLYQARIELKQYFTPIRMLFALMGPVVVLVLIRMGLINWVGGIDAFRWLVSAYVGTALTITGLVTIASTIIGDQEDGTLLRAKTLPGGMLGHLSAKVIALMVESLLSIILTLMAALIGAGEWLIKPTGWLLILPLVIVVAVAVTAPLGLIMGGLARKVSDVIYVSIIGFGIIAISDLLVPPGLMPGWVTSIAKAFPAYWLGYASRLSLLGPESAFVEMSAIEWAVGLLILVVWFCIGILILPKAMRKLSRRQSPSMLDKYSNLVGAM